nr:hypothetical protein [Lachnospiraceae bacterium]
SGKNAVALKRGGEFIKIKNNNYTIGQEIDVRRSNSNIIRMSRRLSAAAAALVLVIGGAAYGNALWNSPVSYVSLDINPSIEYSLNALDRVIEVEGVNDDGVAIAESLGNEIKNKEITDAISLTVEALATENYITVDEQNYIVIGVYSEKGNHLDSVKSKVDSYVPDEEKTLSVSTIAITKEVKEASEDMGISAGKLGYIEEITQAYGTISRDDAAELASYSVAKINQTKEALEAGATIAEALAELEEESEALEDEKSVDASSASKGADDEQTASDDVNDDAEESTSSPEKGNEAAASDDSDENDADSDSQNDSVTSGDDINIPEPVITEPEPTEPEPTEPEPATETGDNGEATTPEKTDDVIESPEETGAEESSSSKEVKSPEKNSTSTRRGEGSSQSKPKA